jgi:hypothetical protein
VIWPEHSFHIKKKGEEMRRRKLLGSSGIERKIILKLFLQKYNIRVWSRFIGPRPGIIGWVLKI